METLSKTPLGPYHPKPGDFYGVQSREIQSPVPRLWASVRHGISKGQPYAYVVFLEKGDNTVTWRIRPVAMDDDNRPLYFGLFRREGTRVLQKGERGGGKTKTSTKLYASSEPTVEAFFALIQVIKDFET